MGFDPIWIKAHFFLSHMFNLINIFIGKFKPFTMFSSMVKPCMQFVFKREHIIGLNNANQINWVWRLDLSYPFLRGDTKPDFITPNRIHNINVSRSVVCARIKTWSTTITTGAISFATTYFTSAAVPLASLPVKGEILQWFYNPARRTRLFCSFAFLFLAFISRPPFFSLNSVGPFRGSSGPAASFRDAYRENA